MEGRDATQIMEALIQHVRSFVGKVAPDADELKVYDTFKNEFLVSGHNSVDFDELNQYVPRCSIHHE